MIKNLNYKQLIEENKVYYIKYGRGAIVGIAYEPLDFDSSLKSLIQESHTQEPSLIKRIEFIDNFIRFDIDVDSEDSFVTRGLNLDIRLTKQIPLSQVTFEHYKLKE